MPASQLYSYLAVAVLAAGYWAWANHAALRARLFNAQPLPAQAEATTDEQWVHTLLRLKGEMESQGKADIAAMVLEILWRVMGGKQHK